MSDSSFNYDRTGRLIEESIERIELDLDGLSVYTEAATGGFAATAATAAAAGAERVYALTADSPYGSAAEARAHTQTLTERVGEKSALVFPEEKNRAEFAEADVVTNTGFVRPFDEQVADWLGPTAAISLMYEPWEFRSEDMDIEALWRNEVPVLGTDESDQRVATQRYLRSLAPKIAFECDLEVFLGDFAVVGSGRMARHAREGLEDLGADTIQLTPSETHHEDSVDSLDAETAAGLDALVVVDHATDRLLVGEDGLVDTNELASRSPGVTVIHICGPISQPDMDAAGVRYVPESPAPAGTMSYTTGYLGPRPIVDLHAAGLRVGADLARELRAGAAFRTATETVAATPLGADFAEEFKERHGFYG